MPKIKMESEYHIHIGKTAGEPAAHLPQCQQPDEPSCHQQQYINQIYSKLHIEGDTRTKMESACRAVLTKSLTFS